VLPPLLPPLPPARLQSSEEPVDIKPKAEKECHSSCLPAWVAVEACAQRIKAKGTGSCEPWAIDYWHCVDKCVRRRRGAGNDVRAPTAHRRFCSAHCHLRRRRRLPLSHYSQAAPKIFAALK
jgi:hypothetical protein